MVVGLDSESSRGNDLRRVQFQGQSVVDRRVQVAGDDRSSRAWRIDAAMSDFPEEARKGH